MKDKPIYVTQPYLPSRVKFNHYMEQIWESGSLTNNGQLVQKLTHRLEEYLGVENLLLVTNGTLALQVAYRALGVSDARADKHPEAITTPFTFIATASSLKWDGVEPVFVDIDPDTWCLDPQYIEAAITPNTRAIVPVHVFGNACDVKDIDAIARKHNLKMIYDASHAFGVKYKGESLLKYGDAATLSFHATKLFHTCEGGAIVFKRKEDLDRAKKMINFGITGPESIEELGINAKMNELQAAMGLCVLDEMEANLSARKRVWNGYYSQLPQRLTLQKRNFAASNNYTYFPVTLASEMEVRSLLLCMESRNVYPRRYFYPLLSDVPFLKNIFPVPISRSISSRVVCLPVYPECEFQRVIELLSEGV